MKKCKKCGYLNTEDAVFCENCGTKLVELKQPKKTKECKKCGYLNAEDAFFCENCGTKLDESKQPKKVKKCKKCGYLNEEVAFCENCGNSLNEDQPIQNNDDSTENEKIEENLSTPKVSTEENNRRSKKNTKSKKI